MFNFFAFILTTVFLTRPQFSTAFEKKAQNNTNYLTLFMYTIETYSTSFKISSRLIHSIQVKNLKGCMTGLVFSPSLLFKLTLCGRIVSQL
jgi:hypothetical protein